MAEPALKSGTGSEAWCPNHHWASCLRPTQKIRSEFAFTSFFLSVALYCFASLCFNGTAVDFSGPNWSPSRHPYSAVWGNDVEDGNQIQNTHILCRTEIASRGHSRAIWFTEPSSSWIFCTFSPVDTLYLVFLLISLAEMSHEETPCLRSRFSNLLSPDLIWYGHGNRGTSGSSSVPFC